MKRKQRPPKLLSKRPAHRPMVKHSKVPTGTTVPSDTQELKPERPPEKLTKREKAFGAFSAQNSTKLPESRSQRRQKELEQKRNERGGLVHTPMTAKAKVRRGDDLAELGKNLETVKKENLGSSSSEVTDPTVNRYAPLGQLAEQEEKLESARAIETAVRAKYNEVYNHLVDLKYTIPPNFRAGLTGPGHVFLDDLLQKISARSFDSQGVEDFQRETEVKLESCTAWMVKVKNVYHDLLAFGVPLLQCDDMRAQLQEMVSETPSFNRSIAAKKELDQLVTELQKLEKQYDTFWNYLTTVGSTRTLKLPKLKEIMDLEDEFAKLGAIIEEAIANKNSPRQRSQTTPKASTTEKISDGEYPYGGPKEVPHIHQVGGRSHLKILDGGRIKRYNIVQNGKRHVQADDALKLANGNSRLTTVINSLLAGY